MHYSLKNCTIMAPTLAERAEQLRLKPYRYTPVTLVLYVNLYHYKL